MANNKTNKRTPETSIKLSLKVSKRNFKSEDGQIIKYYSYEVKIGDETFSLQPRPDDKRMLKYLLNDLFDNEEAQASENENDDAIDNDSEDIPF